jgi:hypothetical protein
LIAALGFLAGSINDPEKQYDYNRYEHDKVKNI